MTRRNYQPQDVIVPAGTVLEALCIVSYGVVVATAEQNGRTIELIRLAPGDYYGEIGLLTGGKLDAEMTALTRVVIYEISKDALCPLLVGRPSMAAELGEILATRVQAGRALLDSRHHMGQPEAGLAEWIAASIRSLFELT